MLSSYVAEGEKSRRSNKIILFWTKYFDIEFWGMDEETYREESLMSLNCPTTNCIFTHNKKHLENPEQYDAIIFHGSERWFNVDLPEKRAPNQLYIVATKESVDYNFNATEFIFNGFRSPGEIKHNLDSDYEFYNMTMTYRMDSDIQWNYGFTVDIKTGDKIAPALNVHWKEPDDDFNGITISDALYLKFRYTFIIQTDSKLMEIVRNKQKTATWFVSHCNVFSRRDALVKKIQDFIEVDIYGKCGTLSCDPSSSKCNEMLKTTYRFYFSFENTLCDDYLTEKLYSTINNFIVPVIYSGATLSRFLPPKSYIDVNDFETAEDLAKYLIFLEENPSEYIKYFWWRKHYKVIRFGDIPFCEICEKLNQPNLNSKRQTYVSIKDWFYKNVCRNPKIKF